MFTEEFEAHLKKALEAIDMLPEQQRAPLQEMVEETRRRHQQIGVSIAAAREALDDWRLIQKYLLFDAEARAREAARKRRSQAPGDDAD